ncbi:hypothetical protein Pyn_34041 [Prunus yedoensis var. nudiflora]|uniref:Uncharacterized protein n=1 Tax=Prunus yedoensis var. nudiflora TaxID=2094558 RepID=A0A314XIQ7_PRUYE|nr:hypothetical protein Pyn_34041 [Prunus yedoensis var. nudiflora]
MLPNDTVLIYLTPRHATSCLKSRRLFVSRFFFSRIFRAYNHKNLRSFILHSSQTPLKCENCACLVCFGGVWCRRWTVDQVDWPRRLSSLSEALYRTHGELLGSLFYFSCLIALWSRKFRIFVNVNAF